jgi:hypothetical protein
VSSCRALLRVLALASLAGCGATAVSTPRAVAPAPAGPAPRLVVVLVIDQWPSYQLAKDRALYRGGLARLLDGGVVATAELPYANTFTAPGHATIGSGVTPRVHGVVGNAWYRRAEGKERPAEDDPGSPVLRVEPGPAGPDGDRAIAPGRGVSGAALRVEGLAGAVHDPRGPAGGRGRVVTLALKARAACMVGGKRPDLAIWYEPAAGGLTTSRAYAAAVPPWLREFDRKHPTSALLGATWEAADPALLAAHTGIDDDAAGERGEHHLGATFPHRLAEADDPAAALVATPMADELILAAAAAAVDGERLGADDAPDLLAVSLGSHDFAGHAWGQDSWEVLDLTLRLDRAIGGLLATLDAKVGRDRYAVVLTSDHGATPMIERGGTAGARRITPTELAAAAEGAIAGVLGVGPWVAKVSQQDVYLTSAWAAVEAARRGPALDAAVVALTAVPGVATATRADTIGPCGAGAGLAQALCESLVPGEAGELLVVPRAGSIVSDYPNGTHHDAPFDDNRRVPLVVVAAGLAPRAVAGTVSSLVIAPTIAALLGVAAPPGATARPLVSPPR